MKVSILTMVGKEVMALFGSVGVHDEEEEQVGGGSSSRGSSAGPIP